MVFTSLPVMQFLKCFLMLLLFFKLPVQVHNLPVLLFGSNTHACLLVQCICMATATAFVSPSVLVVEDVPAAAVVVPVVLVVVLLLVMVMLGMSLYIYVWKKGLRELINTADQFYQFSYICYHSGHVSIKTGKVYTC